MTPWYSSGGVEMHVGHVLDVLAALPAESIQTCVTSPPYYGLRSYNTAPVIWGGSPDCDHTLEATAPGKVLTGGTGTASAKQVSNAGSQYGNAWEERGKRTLQQQQATYGGQCGPKAGAPDRPRTMRPSEISEALTVSQGATCTRCGAWRGELGSEPTPQMYVEHLVEVFRAVKRVLRDDGTLWLNLGSSYSAGVTNRTDCFNRLLEGGAVFYADAESVAVTAHRVGVAAQDQRAPDGVLADLLTTERDGIEHGHEHLSEVRDSLADPGDAGLRLLVSGVLGDTANPEQVVDSLDHRLVVDAELDPQPEPILGVLRTPGTRTGRYDEAALTVDQPDEPRHAEQVRWYAAWDTFARYASGKRTVNIDAVNDAVSLSNRLDTLAGLLTDFRVTQASEQKVTLTSICGRLRLTVTDVRHLWFALRSGSIVPYTTLYKEASEDANALAPKQELGIPWRVAMALQRDGWILRSPIIWSKPNPMPESVTDRPTTAHEHLFLLAKRADYFYDAEAIREPHADDWHARASTWRNGEAKQQQRGDTYHGFTTSAPFTNPPNPAGRNRRSVWTIPTESYPAAHFATYPRKLVEPCVLAGTSARGQCPRCGAPWVRTTGHTCDHCGTVRRANSKPCCETANGWQDGRVARDEWLTDEHQASKAPRKPGAMGNSKQSDLGWAQSCPCPPAEPVPQTVLDPFLGSGTTAYVARHHGRRAVGIELNESYARLAADRLQQGTLGLEVW